MLVLLPPSEGKTSPAGGAPVDLDLLTAPVLRSAREQVLDALAEVSALDDAPARLGVGATLADEVARNTTLRSAPAGQARAVYTGVLYAAAGLGGLEGAALERARESLRVVSALWGVVGPEDRIPAYRLSMGTDLPGVGPLAGFWRPRLEPVLAPVDLVVDLRSTAYAAAWVPPASAQLTVRVEREVEGRRTVVSHWAKHARGALTGHLLMRGDLPRTPAEVLAAALELVGTGPIGRTAPGLMTSELRTAELARGPRGTHVLTLVVG